MEENKINEVKVEGQVNKKMKPCKVCGNMIAKKAKRCPQCGAKNKKPIYKRVWIYIVSLPLILIISIFVYSDIDAKISQKDYLRGVYVSSDNGQVKFDGNEIYIDNTKYSFKVKWDSVNGGIFYITNKHNEEVAMTFLFLGGRPFNSEYASITMWKGEIETRLLQYDDAIFEGKRKPDKE